MRNRVRGRRWRERIEEKDEKGESQERKERGQVETKRKERRDKMADDVNFWGGDRDDQRWRTNVEVR